ncbi:GalNAc-alpha-(1-_4)-GalNAc-alpha-(1-_3)-diNAcBac-PP-undecaprenol alpha-1,4-N-acetyl-D-galactosaminyltransferase [Maribacter caenipelagi]|uniref:GalNAc-alpha-(1->4)-GalNAc-alpha-(1->3)-diNAcBac-PP-undecaprenol alpha-1,4-N-acetyl-D-galactosaminyltransferase n=1 Tax=Maribacter caenipelagi TaxID=1447781 RepID=A0A4R7D3K2_9FLAO|nr:glycosyltransferase [Maribacter caenipelagi]TDS13436.1 GalNAc-alpha-(1->4)-GalNAc-alpha-(1->3)-diNAcBac-PP-undecaprenol alpha-1,4-N-acetyl-D-galactosaminyltransferase [Maribacter caenipelagi]
MKIALVIYGLNASGGAERAVTGLANFLCSNHDTTIITLNKGESFYEIDPIVNLKYCFDKIKTKTNLFKSLHDSFYRINELKKIIDNENSDVVISFMTIANINSIIACKILNKPIVVSERANHAVFKLSKIKEIARNLTYKYAQKLVVQTQGNKDFYSQYFNNLKIDIIPNAIGENLQRQRTLKNSRENIILNVGSFKEGKAQDLLIRAFANLKNKTWKLVFLGKGPNLIRCIELAKELKVSNRIEFLGAQNDVAKYYNIAGMFVFTSEHEGFPNALLEALYFGIPTISTNCPHGPKDLITCGKNGYLIPVGNQTVLENKMEYLINNLKIRQQFSTAAIELSKKYEIKNIGTKWHDLIKSIEL